MVFRLPELGAPLAFHNTARRTTHEPATQPSSTVKEGSLDAFTKSLTI